MTPLKIRKRIAVTSIVVLASVLLALVLPTFIPAFASINSHSMQIQCAGSGAVINYPSGWILYNESSSGTATIGYNPSSNGTSLTIDFPPGIPTSFNYTESGNATISANGYIIDHVIMANGTSATIVTNWNLTSCQTVPAKG